MVKYKESILEMIRPEIQKIADRGNLTWEEWQEIRCNSYEQEILYPIMTNDCLIKTIEKYILPNCRPTKSPAITYDESLAANFVPILIERLKNECKN